MGSPEEVTAWLPALPEASPPPLLRRASTTRTARKTATAASAVSL